MKLKKEVLLDGTGEFEMIGELSIADHIRQTRIRFRKITDCESYITLLIKIMNLKMLFSTDTFTKQTLNNLI